MWVKYEEIEGERQENILVIQYYVFKYKTCCSLCSEEIHLFYCICYLSLKIFVWSKDIKVHMSLCLCLTGGVASLLAVASQDGSW